MYFYALNRHNTYSHLFLSINERANADSEQIFILICWNELKSKSWAIFNEAPVGTIVLPVKYKIKLN